MGIISRIILAVLALVFAVLITPPLFAVIGFPLEANVWLILRLCFAALAVFYIARGFSFPRPQP